MDRSAVVLLLTLVLGAFVAANAGGDEPNNWTYEKEPMENKCGLGKPRLYSTSWCPTCVTKPECITTKCSKDDGKADVKFNLRCMFGGGVKFAAVSYKDVCVNNVNVNKWGKSYGEELVLPKIDCKELGKPVDLRFIVQDKWWYNPTGKALEKEDCCYDKCIHGKPCHTCEFKKNIYIPGCKDDNCKKPMCDQQKPPCPPKIDDCFEYKSHKDHVQVKFNEKCHKKMKHVACSYHDKGEKKFTHHEYSGKSDKDRYFSFDAPCNAEMKWYFEDDYNWNKDAPKCPSQGDSCYEYFKDGNYCNQCGPYHPVHVPDCKKDGKND